MTATSANVRDVTETSSRLLKLLALLQARGGWQGRELAERLEVSPRTIRRDVDRLRLLGYPVEAAAGPAGGYRLHAGTALPPLLLDDDEAVAIAVGLSGAASGSVEGIEETSVRALVKLEQVLPAHLRRRVRALRDATATFAPAGPRVDADALTTIAGACRDREHVGFGYTSRDGSVTRRRVEPHRLVHLGARWYLVAWDCGRADWRTFRVDRVERAAADGGRFGARPLPDGDAAAFVLRSLRSTPHRHTARVTFHAPAEVVAKRCNSPWERVEALDPDRCEYRCSDDSLDWLAARIGMLGVDFEVHEPPELAARFAALALRFARAAGRAAAEDGPHG